MGDSEGLHVAGNVHVLELQTGDAAAVIVDGALGVLGDAAHGSNGLYRVLADRGLAGQHDRGGAVVNCVRDVGNLCAGRTRVLRHALEHLGRGDDALAAGDAGLDDVLLDLRQLLERNLNAQVAAGDHDAVRLVEDLLNVVYAFHVLDLADDLDVFLAVRLEDGLDVADVLCAAGEGSGDEVDVLRQTELDVLAVLVGDKLHVELDARNIDGLAVGERAAVERLADDVGAVDDLEHLERDQTVVDEDAGARLNVVRQTFVGDGDDSVVALDVAGGQGELLAIDDLDLAVLVGLGADLRALGVEHDADRHAELLAGSLYRVHARLVLLVGAVAEVHTGNVHARLDHFGQTTVGRRTEGADNFSFAHQSYSSLYQITNETCITLYQTYSSTFRAVWQSSAKTADCFRAFRQKSKCCVSADWARPHNLLHEKGKNARSPSPAPRRRLRSCILPALTI